MDTKTVLAIEVLHDLKIGLEKFGTYTFFDKGPEEVMNIDAWADKFKTQSIDYVAETLKDILKDEEYGPRLVSSILMCLEEWDELWEKYETFLHGVY